MSEQKRKPTDEELIQTNGRHFAGDILQEAVSSAKNVQDLNNKLHVLNCMAIHVLATNLFNRINATQADKDQLLEETNKLLKDELELIFEHQSEMETIAPNENADQ